MFIELTHTYSGDTLHVRADKIHTIRGKSDKTLVITEPNVGQYVNETPEQIKEMISEEFSKRHTVNICME